MRVAIVHPWFLVQGGGEKVVEEIAAMYPDADIYALFSEPNAIPATLKEKTLITSSANKVPWLRRHHREAIALYPTLIESFDMSGYDLVISSAGPVTFGVNVAQDARHICYCHSPGRSWWDQYAERQRSLSPLARGLYTTIATYVRTWEFSAAQRVDYFVSNSRYIRKRVAKYFRRESTVIHPPVDTSRGYLSRRVRDYYLTLGRIEERKRVDLLIRACNKLGRPLAVVGVGTEIERLKAIAGPTIEFLGWVPDTEARELYANCRAFLFAADEDFGIAPVEAQSYGRPVIAYGHGGSLETVRVNDPQGRPDTGVYFPQQTIESLVDAILRFEQIEHHFDPVVIRKHSQQFDTAVFTERFKSFVDAAMAQESVNEHSDHFVY